MPGTYYMPGVNLIHRGALKDVGTWAARLGGTKGLIVASLGSYGESQARLLVEVLARSGIGSAVFAGAGPNPTDAMVARGAAEYRDRGCDFLLAIGGGSAMDCAKGIGLVVSNGGAVADYAGTDRATKELPPFIAVNTTAGTGSEVTSVAVITDGATHRKMMIVDWRLTADVSVNDPELMLSMPPELTAYTGMDALSHAIEAYLATNATALSDSLAYESIVLAFAWLPAAFSDGRNVPAREGMCNAAFLAGLAFNNSGLGYVHALSHPLTGKYGLPHGLLNALLLPAVMRWNATRTAPRMARIAVAMGVGHPWRSDRENAEKAIAGVEDLNRRLRLPPGLAALGVKEADLPELARAALEESVAATNPRQAASAEQLLNLYLEAM